MPCAPFVHHELDATLPVNLTHRSPMPQDQVLHTSSLFEQLVPIINREINRLALASRSAIIVHRPPIKPSKLSSIALGQPRKETPRPLLIASIWTRADQKERQAITWNPGGEFPELGRVLFRR